MNGRIFDIARFSLHDGPGIRTVVFLKGCTLRCIWCHNPESYSAEPTLLYEPEKCMLDGNCVAVCPEKCFSIKAMQHFFDRSCCTLCGKCADKCYPGVLKVAGRIHTVEEVVGTVLKDIDYYGDNGGVTFSGGEPLVQADFIHRIMLALKEKNIHIAIETCGNVPWANFKKVLSATDLFLYDLKCIDDEKHEKFTGSSNALILDNLRNLSAENCNIEVRMLQVPTLNSSEKDIHAAGEFIASLPNPPPVRLLPYYSMAKNKYAACGFVDTMPAVPTPDADQLSATAAILEQYQLNVIKQ